MVSQKKIFLLYLAHLRGVAQPGRASALGAECRQFDKNTGEQRERKGVFALALRASPQGGAKRSERSAIWLPLVREDHTKTNYIRK